MIKLVTNVLGVFAVKNNRVIESRLFEKDAKEVAKKLSAAADDVCEEEEELIQKLAETGVDEIHVENPQKFWGRKLGVNFIEDATPSDPVWISSQIGADEKQVLDLVTEVNTLITLEKLREVESDSTIVQAVGALDELEESANKLAERLREWYSIHYPELDHIIVKHDMYARLVAKVGDKNNYGKTKAGLDADFEKKIIDAANNSLGATFSENDVKAVQNLAGSVHTLTETRKNIESYIEETMKEIAPNTAEIAGSLLGGRLIAKAGGIKKLALMPASTIQVLGAEDAFFRFLKTKKNPPKHGIIFQHPHVRSAGRKTRGKIARSLAAKIAIASRIDTFKGKFVGDKLKKDFEKRVNSLKQQQ